MRPPTWCVAVLLVPSAAMGCRSEPAPCPACPEVDAAATGPGAPSSSAATAGASDAGTSDAGVAADGAAAAPDENPWCERGEPSYGAWTATPEEVLAAARKLVAAGCASKEWFLQAAGDCMQRLDRSNVTVMAGVMVGERWTPQACQIAVSSVEWHGRRWVAFHSEVRDGHAFFGFVSAVELTPKGPVLVTDDCQGSPTASTGPRRRRPRFSGWESLPQDLRTRLCAP